MARRALAAAVIWGCALALASAALAGNGGIAPPDSVTDSGSAINRIYWFLFGICAFIFLVVEGALVWFLFRSRRRRSLEHGRDAPQIHGNTRLEIIWTAIPLAIVVVIAAVAFASVPDVNANPPDENDALLIRVDSHQFYWQYTYPNGAISLDTLRIPVGRTIRLELHSGDVIHSWWVNEITGKRDAIPGQTNYLNFKPERTGTFRGQCAELCGLLHAVMYTEVQILPADEYESWVNRIAAAQSGVGGTSDLGKEEFQQACAKCHGMSGQGDIGPGIVGKITSRASLERLLENGQDTSNIPSYMPPVGDNWTDRQVNALYEYMTTTPALRGGGENGG
jgi:cytochrome c oxidase subunit II